ncbi:hypothetical protein YP76_05960 [Sphingobium chungbukense]|uniref:Uncharacterized protein n=1 Tax=Sphingobium chungbukense TaxID=56193 RepID=A0A0M3AU80_9SPHN|nr:hypothetical protein YP76_05960 [Sphingobium chungbukense]
MLEEAAGIGKTLLKDGWRVRFDQRGEHRKGLDGGGVKFIETGVDTRRIGALETLEDIPDEGRLSSADAPRLIEQSPVQAVVKTDGDTCHERFLSAPGKG